MNLQQDHCPSCNPHRVAGELPDSEVSVQTVHNKRGHQLSQDDQVLSMPCPRSKGGVPHAAVW